MEHNHLCRQSIQLIRENQAGSGAYVASPAFPSYAYCWLRDGSFIAHAMDLVGEHESSRAFFRWVDRTIERHRGKAEQLLEKLQDGQAVSDDEFLHTRYTLAGEEATEYWWNFQLDGYGTWLWALGEHMACTDDVVFRDETGHSVEVTARYLCALWCTPSYDCWEEHPEYLHPYTLAAIFGGLRAVEALIEETGSPALISSVANTADDILDFLMDHGIREGHVVKHIPPPDRAGVVRDTNTAAVDASLIGLAVPYRLLEPKSRPMMATIGQIQADLCRPEGGVYRYLGDTYYGGGEWLLLAGWLGWYHVAAGNRRRAREQLNWIEAQADEEGRMPEQVSDHLLAPHRYAEWKGRWGPIAKPLLWSHAMYLILHQALESMGGDE